jgi:NADH-quinone oxidoreductase subunit L
VTLALVVAIPLATAVAIAIVGGRLGRRTLGMITTAAMVLSFGAGASMIATLRDRPTIGAFIGAWLPLPGADVALVVDSSMLAVALTIAGVSALIALYSIDYLAHDRGLQGYFAAFSLLVAAMLVVVLASNLLLLVAGWELAGAATYLLVGHHRDHPPAAAAALKTFLIERAGDAALLAGTFLLLAEFHTVDIAQLGGAAIEHGNAAGAGPVLASALLLVGALAKSAQIPLHAWLPDATEAPTPVSALIQTVAVTGGVVLLMRLRSVLVPDVLQAAAVIGGVTAFVGAVVAVAQRDVRRVLAWSTISQVGLMFVGAGLGALFAARFQLIAHALLKAVLVLGAGSVRRATGDESDVGRYGGVARRMPARSVSARSRSSASRRGRDSSASRRSPVPRSRKATRSWWPSSSSPPRPRQSPAFGSSRSCSRRRRPLRAILPGPRPCGISRSRCSRWARWASVRS